MKAIRVVTVSCVLGLMAMLAVGAGAVPVAGPCVPGAAYDPACDVDRDGAITVTDIQLTAGHWQQTGTWTGDNSHDHLGQTWTGSNNPLKIQGSFGSPDYAPLVLSNSNAGGDGLIVSSAGDGVNVISAGNIGVRVASAGLEGVYVGLAGDDGFDVNIASDDGLFVDQAGDDGVSVGSAGDDGFFVAKTGSATAYGGSANHNGVEIGNAEGHGVYVNSTGTGYNGVHVGSAGADGVHVGSANEDGVFVGSADYDGVAVDFAGDDGFSVCTAGSPTSCNPSSLRNGVEIGRTENNGMYVIEAGTNGVYANTTQASGQWGFYTPDMIHGSNVLLQRLSLVAQVSGTDALTPGDLVAAAGVADPLPGSPVHVPRVRLADGKSGGVVGVVETRLALVPAGELLPADDGSAPIESLPPELHSADGPAQPGDYVAITIYGATLTKVDRAAVIEAGQRLTAAELPGRARALRSKLLDDMLVSEAAPVIGVALAAPSDGLVWVLVNPQ